MRVGIGIGVGSGSGRMTRVDLDLDAVDVVLDSNGDLVVRLLIVVVTTCVCHGVLLCWK